MKHWNLCITLLLGILLISPDAFARGGSRGSSSGGSRGGSSSLSGSNRASSSGGSRGGSSSFSGGNRASSSSFDRPSSGSRNPTTGSSLSKPSTRPSTPTTRPSTPSSRPSTPSSRPSTLPATKPSVQRPTTLPSTKPGSGSGLPDAGNRPGSGSGIGDRPGSGSGNRPDTGVGNRPGQGSGISAGNRPTTLPADNRPSINRPTGNRPTTLPGMVTYPNRPGMGNNSNRPGMGNNSNRPGMGNNSNRPGNLNRPSTLPSNNGRWDNNKWGGNHGVWGNNNNVNIKINNNFSNNYNYSHRPDHWGDRPWWGASNCHGWHHGHWGYGYSSSYYHHHWWCDDDDFARGFMWGIGVWSFGNLIYNMGYQTYSNPYPAPVVQNTYVTYNQPVSVAAAAHPPGDEATVTSAEAKSNEASQRSRDAFAKGDYITASKALDEAIAATPGDVTLHEYRSLIFFALGKFSDAAGVLNPVLASGPGWGWETMIGFYNNSETYNQQLRKLEDYTKSAPTKADARFLLGYHYMVCGHMKEANLEFSKASELQPADSISRQLRDLTKSSIPETSEPDSSPPTKPDLMTQTQLPGLWVSDRGKEGKITFELKADGAYTWSYLNEGRKSDMNGTYSINDNGLLVMTTDDTQMIVELVRKDDKNMKFTIIGAPDGDPGLEFTKG